MRLIIDVNTKYCTERTSFVHILAQEKVVSVRHGNMQCGKLTSSVVDPDLVESETLAGSGHGFGTSSVVDPDLVESETLAGSGHGFGKNTDPGSSGSERNLK